MEMNDKIIGVLMGGLSPERDVSLVSGKNVYESLIRTGHNARSLIVDDPDMLIEALNGIDVLFPVLHGGIGEDGTLQLLFEVMGIPYAGSQPLACATAMNKLHSKRALTRAHLQTPAYLEKGEESWKVFAKRVTGELGFPCVVKPINEGSSVGIHIVKSSDEFVDCCKKVEMDYAGFFVEQFIQGKEITVGILRIVNDDVALPPIELRPKNEFYDYEAKYTPGMTEFIIPAEIDDQTSALIKDIGQQAHVALGCSGFSRVDIMLDENNEIYILEVNTTPGMTETSDLPQAAEAQGISFDQLCELMLRTALLKNAETVDIS
jgi:D-alanine-D-alanine ligase